MTIDIVEPQLNDLDALAEIFNAYRVFYHQKHNFSLARHSIQERLNQKDSKIFIAKNQENCVMDFVQLYPTFSSVSASKAWLLNDLYVDKNYRRQGIAEQLMTKAIELGKTSQAKYLALETGFDNLAAQTLYKRMGFIEQNQTMFFEYSY
ncbi:GNAT family N-acetyltransferase [Acinetobacter rathckeae]|uniref:GNAT family N-acetyltransferase n=1 Tax=Acinetobacter rathckeae TaxID=2605272 RepID=UPI0018A2F9EC|nr:GNAT family N-acetyltransferase [Acinetobacter rathckeae]MBF7695043.1 GNAT family N-acetyltransferase [Acinetobacter rathckeae]